MRRRNLDIMGLWESLKMNSDKLLTCMYIVSRENKKYIEARDDDNKKEISPQHNKSQKKTTKPPLLLASANFHEVARADGQGTCRRRDGFEG